MAHQNSKKKKIALQQPARAKTISRIHAPSFYPSFRISESREEEGTNNFEFKQFYLL